MIQSKRINLTNSQVGVIGDNVTVYGGIHYHIEPPANPRERRNRQAMLKRVHNTWIKGLLEQSLHGAAMLELGMEYHPDAVDHPWDTVVQMPERPDKQLPPGTRTVDVFDEIGNSLLILGEPGSGKTTILLELARDLIARAEQDETLHIPVVFNLSSWAVKQLPLEEWLVEELRTKYYIPKKIAQAWIREDVLLLLLDGLDEVKADAREKSVAAINTFRQEHLIPLAVCSRIADYEGLTSKLRLQGAICLQSLTPEQINAYLTSAGQEAQATRDLLQHDKVLQEMARYPLFLNIVMFAHRSAISLDLQTPTTPEVLRKHLFNAFVKQMFQRRAKVLSYSQEQTLSWLSYLANQMIIHSQSLFHIEDLQPTWLAPHFARRARRLGQLLGAAAVGLVLGLIVGLIGGLALGIFEGLVAGLSVGLGVALGNALVFATVFHNKEQTYSRQDIRNIPFAKQAFTLYVVYLCWMSVGLFLGLFFGLDAELGVGQGSIHVAGLGSGFSVGLVFWLFGISLGKLGNGKPLVEIVPNRNIRRWILNVVFLAVVILIVALIGGGIIGLFVGRVVILVGGLIGGLIGGLLVGLLVGFSVGFVLGVGWGGVTFCLYLSTRYTLSRSNFCPWRLAPFLTHCVDRIFLYRVGNNYIFIHRLLQEHFASLTSEDIDRLVANTEGGRA